MKALCFTLERTNDAHEFRTRSIVRRLISISAVAVTVGLGGCGRAEPSRPAPASDLGAKVETTAAPGTMSVEVPITAKSGSSLTGTAVFTEVPDGVRVVVEVSGVAPGKHGVHVHEKDDCSAADAKSAGDHFNPDGHPHALPPQEPRHIGDFGNMEVDSDGKGRLEAVAPQATLREGDRHSFHGRAIVVHAKPDDGSQPSGNAGDRIGCGEIRVRR